MGHTCFVTTDDTMKSLLAEPHRCWENKQRPLTLSFKYQGGFHFWRFCLSYMSKMHIGELNSLHLKIKSDLHHHLIKRKEKQPSKKDTNPPLEKVLSAAVCAASHYLYISVSTDVFVCVVRSSHCSTKCKQFIFIFGGVFQAHVLIERRVSWP